MIKEFGQLAQPDEWVTTDMPWATAWYADRASLWLPDSISDFENFNDNVCPTGVILLTPVIVVKTVQNLHDGRIQGLVSVGCRTAAESSSGAGTFPPGQLSSSHPYDDVSRRPRL